MLSNGPQVNFFPSFQTISAVRNAGSSSDLYMPYGKQHTGHHEVQSHEPINKIKK
jgi:hypothetical protein